MPDIHKMKNFFILFLSILVASNSGIAQKLTITKENGKIIQRYKKGKSMDFRIDYNVLYPGKSDSILESRVYGIIDSIVGNEIYLIENIIVMDFSKDNTHFLEESYDFTELTVTVEEIKSLSYTPIGQSIGNALFSVGLAALIVSPIFGFLSSSDGYNMNSFGTVAAVGLGTMAIGGTIYFTFKEKPFKFKDFYGPDYFKKYQPGSLSVVE